MTYVLVGNTAPVHMLKREVPSDPDEARSLLEDLLTRAQLLVEPEKRIDVPAFMAEIHDDHDRIAGMVEEYRIATPIECPTNETITQFNFPADWSPMDQVKSFEKAWKEHSSEPPAWIEADNEAVQVLLIAAFTDAQGNAPLDKMPQGWMADTQGNPAPLAWGPMMTALMPSLVVPLAILAVASMSLHLRTNAGRDFQCRVMGDGDGEGGGNTPGTGTMRPADYLAITENATAPAAGDTTVTGELTAGGLARAQAAYAHTAAALTYTLIYEWTSSDGTARTINKCGVLNASTVGTLVFESLVPSPPTLVAGDSLRITVTVDIT